MQKISEQAREFFENVLPDEQPLFVSDEATILDLSLASPEELARRCAGYYRVPVSSNDLAQPLWKLIRQLNQLRGS